MNVIVNRLYLTVSFPFTEIVRFKQENSVNKCTMKQMILVCNSEIKKDEDSLRMQDLLALNTMGTDKWKEQFCLYKQFVEFGVVNVVGKTRMKKMGMNYADGVRQYYEDAIKPTDEAFAMLCLEDRWELWVEIAEKRIEEEGNDGTRALVCGDEDDQRPRNEADKKIVAGSANLTKFSMYGKYNTQGKGFVPGRSYTRLSNYKTAIEEFRETNEGRQLLSEVRDWWGEKYKGPKMKVKPVMDDIEIESGDECDDFGEDDLDISS